MGLQPGLDHRRSRHRTPRSPSNQDLCRAFSKRFQGLGGKVVAAAASFRNDDGTISRVAARVDGKRAKVVALCTASAADQPKFVDWLRAHGSGVPVVNGFGGDGSSWWSTRPLITGYYFLTAAAAIARDPDPAIRSFEATLKAAGHPATTGGLHHRGERDRDARLRDRADTRLDRRREARRRTRAPAPVQHARRVDQLLPGPPQRHRPPLQGDRGDPQPGEGGGDPLGSGRRHPPLHLRPAPLPVRSVGPLAAKVGEYRVNAPVVIRRRSGG